MSKSTFQRLRIPISLIAFSVIFYGTYRIVSATKVGTNKTISGKVLMPLLRMTAHSWLTNQRPIIVTDESDSNVEEIFFAETQLQPIYNTRKENEANLSRIAIVRAAYYRNILGLNIGERIEIVTPGFVPMPK
jgi:hypothetical protein